MSRRYDTIPASPNPAVRLLPYHIVRGDDYKSAGIRAWDEQQLTNASDENRPDPPGPRRQKQKLELTQQGFDKMLALLDRDRDMAGRKYEVIRRKLQKFFECRGCPIPDDLADETITLVARKIDQGQQIIGDEPVRYFHGVARNVIRDYWRRSARWSESSDCLGQSYGPIDDPTQVAESSLSARRIEELERCLRQLPDENRELIIRYYECEGVGKKAGRRMLARQMGIHSNTLRLRIHRIRLKLRRDFDEPQD